MGAKYLDNSCVITTVHVVPVILEKHVVNRINKLGSSSK